MNKASLALIALLAACPKEEESHRFEGDILIRHSAGKIVDVYKTTQEVWCDHLAQCRIGENYDNAQIRLFGEMKLVKVSDVAEWNSYVEYHSEQETITYEQKLVMHHK